MFDMFDLMEQEEEKAAKEAGTIEKVKMYHSWSHLILRLALPAIFH